MHCKIAEIQLTHVLTVGITTYFVGLHRNNLVIPAGRKNYSERVRPSRVVVVLYFDLSFMKHAKFFVVCKTHILAQLPKSFFNFGGKREIIGSCSFHLRYSLTHLVTILKKKIAMCVLKIVGFFWSYQNIEK